MDKDKLVELYNSDLSNRKIAEIMGVHHKTVAAHLSKLGLLSKRLSSSTPRVNVDSKVCTKCGVPKATDQYQRGRRGQEDEYEFSYCNSCRNKQIYESLNSSFDRYFKDRFNRWRRTAIYTNVEFSITYDQLLEIFNNQRGLCFYTDVTMIWGVNLGGDRNIISIDKVIPALGYIDGNVVLCSNRANTIKCDQTMSEMKEWMPDWHRRLIECDWLKCLQVDYGNF